MTDETPGGAYLGADGVLHDANGKPIAAPVPEPMPEEQVQPVTPAPLEVETLVEQTERLAASVIPRRVRRS